MRVQLELQPWHRLLRQAPQGVADAGRSQHILWLQRPQHLQQKVAGKGSYALPLHLEAAGVPTLLLLLLLLLLLALLLPLFCHLHPLALLLLLLLLLLALFLPRLCLVLVLLRHHYHPLWQECQLLVMLLQPCNRVVATETSCSSI
jgi:hypothetical protein